MQRPDDRIDTQPRPGSASHYCLVFTPQAQRPTALALYALCRELDAAREASDPGVARLKLQWWREELSRAAAGQARHPITQQLTAQGTAGLATLGAAVDHRERELVHDAPATEAQFAAWAAAGPGSLLSFWAGRLAAGEGCAWQAGVDTLALALQRLDVLQRSLTAARRGIMLHPRERLERFGVAPAALAHPHPDAAVKALVEAERDRAQHALQRVLDDWPQALRPAHTPLLVLTDLRLRTLLEQRKHPLVRLDERVVLPPLRKLWHAWRRARACHTSGSGR